MTTLTIDTLAYAKKLKSAGFTEMQAEAMSDAFKEAQQASFGELATKADLLQVKTELEGKINLLSAQMKLYFIVLLSVIFITNPKALELIAKILGIVK